MSFFVALADNRHIFANFANCRADKASRVSNNRGFSSFT